MMRLKGADQRSLFVSNAFTRPDVPFHWAFYEVTDTPSSTERCGYVVHRQGAYQSEMVLQVFAVFYGSSATRETPPISANEVDSFPIGALALSCTAVRSSSIFIVYSDFKIGGARVADVVNRKIYFV